MNKNSFLLWLRELHEALRAYDWRLETYTLSATLFIKFLTRIEKKTQYNFIAIGTVPVAVIYRSQK